MTKHKKPSANQCWKLLKYRTHFSMMAGVTGLRPAASGVTGRFSRVESLVFCGLLRCEAAGRCHKMWRLLTIYSPNHACTFFFFVFTYPLRVTGKYLRSLSSRLEIVPNLTHYSKKAFNYQLVRLAIPAKALKRRTAS